MLQLEKLVEFNRRHYQAHDYPLLHSLKKHWLRDKPLANLKILHNIPLTFETAVKLESLVAAGAKLTVTHTQFAPIPVKQEVVSILANLGIDFIADHKTITGEFDIALDCCVESFDMPNVIINKGIVELTQTGGSILKQRQLAIPAINVDDSYLKNLECMYGTGEACVRALNELIDEDITNKPFVIFGYGKVGRGVVRYLSEVTSTITIIEANAQALNHAKRQGFSTVDVADDESLNEVIANAFCLVTATGENKLLSKQFTNQQLQHLYIANMGAENEVGDIDSDKVLFAGAPINFSLQHPTLMHFIDPIFYAHNIAAQLLTEQDLSTQYHRFPQVLDTLIIDSFNRIHGMNITDIYE